MISKIEISNFRSLGDHVVIEPGKLNFIVGTNGSGKSNTLHALTFVQEAVRIGLPGAITNNNGIDSIRRHSSGHPHNVRIVLSINLPALGNAQYGFEIAGDSSEEYSVKEEWASIPVPNGSPLTYRIDKSGWDGPKNLRPNIDKQNLAITSLGGDARIQPLWSFLSRMVTYSIYPDILRKPQKFSSDRAMKPRGENWLSIINQQAKEEWIKDLEASLKKLTGDIDGIKIEKLSGHLVAQFHHAGRPAKAKAWYGADLESDGTLRVAGLLAALLQRPALPLIGIEEPELTVHPGAIPLIYDHLVQASQESQIFVTTHSPILLDYIDLDQSRVFVASKHKSRTSIQTLTQHTVEQVRNNLMSLGDILSFGWTQLDLDL